MKATYMLLFSLLILFVCTTTAQQKIIVHPNTTQHQPGARLLSHKESKSIFKINLSSAFRSDYCISYEQKLSGNFSTEITPGFTHYNYFLESYDFFTYKPQNLVQVKRKYNTSFSIKTAIRYYIRQAEGNLTGAYLSAEAMYRSYNYKAFSNYTSGAGQEEKSIQNEIRLLYGVQNRDYYDRFYYDCSIGAGYRYHQRNYLGFCGPTNFSEQALFYSAVNYVVFVINVKIGFTFIKD